MNEALNNLETLTADEAAQILKIDVRTVYRKCESNEIPHFRIGKTGAVRFIKAKFLQWIEEQHNPNTITDKIQ